MKFLSWFGGKHANKKQNTYPTTCQRKQEPREEFSDWPHSLLAIGTFGNSSNNVIINENPSSEKNNNVEDPSSSSSITDQEIAVDFSPEEIGKLQKELTKLLRRKPTNVEKEIAAELPLDRFLNCPSSLEVDRRISNAATICSDNNNIININNINSAEEDNNNNKEENIDKTLSVILGKCKEISADKKNMKAVGKKSIAFLLKKMFVCTSGFAPTAPTLRDTLQESRMDKLLYDIMAFGFEACEFLKDKRTSSSLSLGINATMDSNNTAATTLDLLAKLQNSEDDASLIQNASAPQFLNNFMEDSSVTQSNLRSSSPAKMTIFYDGKVIMFDAFPAEKATEVMEVIARRPYQMKNPKNEGSSSEGDPEVQSSTRFDLNL
ncbi:hypothetical protein RIF29_18185 [Crotalaria pallida]|uniref:Tify domain-containing protein n=1 Tax=Crotalaria pallida TaxID=3830 RepID=A0AAN9FLS5_CROPI